MYVAAKLRRRTSAPHTGCIVRRFELTEPWTLMTPSTQTVAHCTSLQKLEHGLVMHVFDNSVLKSV